MSATIYLLLQASQPATPGGGAPAGPGGLIASPMFLILLMLGVFWFVMFRGNRKEKQKKEAMLNAVAKNDRVLTIGGIIGTVVQVKGEELVIKVDESTNTKIIVIRSAVRQVLDRDETPAEVGK
jgi:preprotein translocase subunit YajC